MSVSGHHHPWHYRRTYRGPLRAVVLDWAGTTVDFGCMAPADVFVQAFAAFDVPITTTEARAPMGRAKRDHIAAIIHAPRVSAAWTERYGCSPTDTDVDELYARFLPLQLDVVAAHSALIPAALNAVALMRARGLKIGTTTGYPRSVMAVVERRAAEQGYRPDCVIAAEDTPVGRPSPLPALKAMIELAVWPVEAVVKIGDTVADIEEGLNAGCWSVGVTDSGNEVGLDLAAWQGLSPEEQAMRRQAAAVKLIAAGAHAVIDSIADAGPVLDQIEAALARGERP
ncbi:MAG: phosphonoacetaldehyde hydrolase [Rhodospirillales bacterium]|nr:phosphonoacetaldehyde hydrolase [Rhodospirillales bacterium]